MKNQEKESIKTLLGSKNDDDIILALRMCETKTIAIKLLSEVYTEDIQRWFIRNDQSDKGAGESTTVIFDPEFYVFLNNYWVIVGGYALEDTGKKLDKRFFFGVDFRVIDYTE